MDEKKPDSRTGDTDMMGEAILFEDKPPPEKPKKKLRTYTEEEMADIIKERGLDKPTTTTGDTRVVRELTRIRKNLDVMLLVMHTMSCLSCGVITALAIYLQHKWLGLGAGTMFAFVVMTMLLNMVTKSGNLKDIVNSEDLIRQLMNLTQEELTKLMRKAQETGYKRL